MPRAGASSGIPAEVREKWFYEQGSGPDHDKETHRDSCLWKLTDSRLTAGEPAWEQTRLSAVGDSCVVWSVFGILGSRMRIYPWSMSWLFGAHSL